MQHTDIDPALGLMGEFGKVTKGTVRHINQMRQEAIFADGAVPARYKALAATLWAVLSDLSAPEIRSTRPCCYTQVQQQFRFCHRDKTFACPIMVQSERSVVLCL